MIESLFQRKNFYYVYIATNDMRSKCAVGLSGSLRVLLGQWAGPLYNSPECCHLVYYEAFESADAAIKKEKELRKLSKQKMHHFITAHNREWVCLNDTILEKKKPVKSI